MYHYVRDYKNSKYKNLKALSLKILKTNKIFKKEL